jgi:hypothetical protein
LFYLGPDRRMMAAEVITAGGPWFVIISEGEGAASEPATVVVNCEAGPN